MVPNCRGDSNLKLWSISSIRKNSHFRVISKVNLCVFQTITTLQGEDIVFLATDVTLPGAVDWVMMQSCFGSHFMLVLEKQEKFDGHVQFFAG